MHLPTKNGNTYQKKKKKEHFNISTVPQNTTSLKVKFSTSIR